MKMLLAALLLTLSVGASSEQADCAQLAQKDPGPCIGQCGAEQGMCIAQCNGKGECIAQCNAAHGRCVARCHSARTSAS